jgi:putative ABC transport system permease protein
MLLYNVRLAWKSLRRHPVLSLLIVAGIALGVGVATAFITVYHVLGQDPVPRRSGVLYYVRMDSWDPTAPHPDPTGIPPKITYRDMREIMKSRIPVRQTATYQAALALYPADRNIRASLEPVRMAFSDFFPMFDVPFRFGSGWDRAADAKPEAVVVISSGLNDRLFGGANSVGRSIRLADRDFRIVGVLAPWRPRVRFYDMTGNSLAPPEGIFLPFNWIEPMEIRTAGGFDGWKSLEGNPSFVERLHASESVFLQMWVELHGEAQVRAYHGFLDAYAREQKKFGRFQRPLDNRVTPIRDVMVDFRTPAPQIRAVAAVSILFLVVAALNLVGLFLGKFLARAPVVGVRRALGASRASIFLEHLIECELVGLIGGAIGLLLSLGVLAYFNRVYGRLLQMEGFFQLDVAMIGAAILLSLVAGAIAGVYPAWRICSIPPSHHLKNQ